MLKAFTGQDTRVWTPGQLIAAGVRRTVSVLTATIFGLAVPKAGAANQALVNAAVCAMLDKPNS